VWKGVTAALPDIVFFPEESQPLDFAITAPLQVGTREPFVWSSSDLNWSRLQDDWNSAAIPVNAAVKLMWPKAFSLQLMQV
jgi:hypothetical protein